MSEPALTAEEWAALRFTPLSCDKITVGDDGDGLEFVTYDNGSKQPLTGKYKIESWDSVGIAGVVAVANSCLRDDDQRKFTRERLSGLREKLEWADEAIDYRWAVADAPAAHATVQELRVFLDALESYLPPGP